MDAKSNAEKSRAPVRRWTAKEDETLRNGVLAYLRKNQQPKYSEICKRLSFRTVKQAKERWRNSLNPSITKGLWSTEEVVQLLDLIIEKGENWTEIQQVLSHRSMHCIKSKGRKLLGEAISKKLKKACNGKITKVWDEEERKELLKLHRVHKYDMESICFALKTGKSMAEAHRELVLRCSCDSCTAKLKALRATKVDFKLAWAVNKARELKEEIARGEFKQRGAGKRAKKASATTSRKRSFAEITSDLGEDLNPLDSNFDSDCSSDIGSLDYNLLSDEELSFEPLAYEFPTCDPVIPSNSLYANVLKDAQNANKLFHRCAYETHASKRQRVKADMLDFADLEMDLRPNPLTDNVDDFFASLDSTPLDFAPVVDEKPTRPRRTSIIKAMNCLNQHCISVN